MIRFRRSGPAWPPAIDKAGLRSLIDSVSDTKPPLDILLCSPRGFCAGVDRAIQIVELALKKFGPPVYVRHEIVHNRYVVDGLKAKGAVFVEELDEIPETEQPVIFSAHGVAKAVPEAAAAPGPRTTRRGKTGAPG